MLEQGHYEGNTLIVKSGTKGQHVGELDLEFDMNTRRIVSADAKLIAVDSSIDPDREYTVGTTISMVRKSRFDEVSYKATVGSSQQMFMDAFKVGSP